MSYEVPESVVMKIKRNAPTYAASFDDGRREGYYGGYDSYGSSYKGICIYVQNGLEQSTDLFNAIARVVFRIQSSNKRQYPLIVFGFGSTDHLQHEKKYFPLGFVSSSGSWPKIAETIARISGPAPAIPATIPELYPKTDIRSLYQGKTRINDDDLLIIIGKKGEVFLEKGLERQMTSTRKKRILRVEIGPEVIAYYTASELSFSYLSLAADEPQSPG